MKKEYLEISGHFLKQKKKDIREIREESIRTNEKLIKDGIIGDIKTIFEQEGEEDYDKPKRASSFWNNNCIQYESNGDTITN